MLSIEQPFTQTACINQYLEIEDMFEHIFL